ncbi:tetratricopeptide repeat protein [Leptospira sp. GIMC2001]|uniref:tetratricopeptide repeat protein n=1 Tax=Leptospira sp. GIMC2001 TaxID=1513297 RepID=UPI00234B1143|nr:tetratricopeptide repeat protein [Leptospira sp. GIMC2001]WCL51121.1 tetratricopeptide repeat protein [Leptospira sp. GIMC2001]
MKNLRKVFPYSFFPFLKIFLFFLGISCFSFAVHSQVTIDGKLYPDLLWGEGEEDPSDFPNGGLIIIPEDFIVTTGKLWEGEPPRSMGSFKFQDKTITNSAKFNNEIVEILLKAEPKERAQAEEMLKAGILYDPRFFAFRYNYGRLLHLSSRYDEALAQFEFAKSEIPEFYRTYIHIGILSLLKNENYYAIKNFKDAVSRNSFDITALVLLAEHYLETGLKNRAKLYLDRALTIDDGSPNAKLGLARLEMEAGNHYRAYMILNKTELYSPEGKEKSYDKKFHYYFAETASKVQDYATAESQYNKILEYPNDPFFGSFSYKVIQRRRDITKKFADAKKTQLEDDVEKDVSNFK